jgi:signal transduction histidine kinase
VAVMQDVTKQRQAEQERLQSERLAAIGQMVAGLAHESRNALQRAQACLDLLALEVEDHPDQLDLTQKVHRALSDLHRHYEEVRNYAAPIVLERRSVSLAGIWRSTWRDLETLRGLSSFELTLPTMPDDQLICQVDEHRIQQVFCNIIENSLASCGEQGRLSIDVEELSQDGQSWYRIIFRDDGPGFDPEAARQAFQPFFTTRQKGTGLGLAICRRIVEAHGGRMQINVDCCDGAEIEVLLPKEIRSDNHDVAQN